MSVKPTHRQNWYLNLVSAKPASTRDLLDGRQLVERHESIDACYSTLYRMAKRGWVWRRGDGLWSTTVQGEGIRSGSFQETRPHS